MKQERVDKINYYLDIAGTVAQRSTCRRRIYGAVIVQHDEIVSTGYVGVSYMEVSLNETFLSLAIFVPYSHVFPLSLDISK